jgi:hypothetical protein
LCSKTDAYTEDSRRGQKWLVGDAKDGQDLQKGKKTDDPIGGCAQERRHGPHLCGPMEVANLLTGPHLEPFHEKSDDPQQDNYDNENCDKLRCFVTNKDDDVLMPIMGEDIGKAFFLRYSLQGHGQMEHDTGILAFALGSASSMQELSG